MENDMADTVKGWIDAADYASNLSDWGHDTHIKPLKSLSAFLVANQDLIARNVEMEKDIERLTADLRLERQERETSPLRQDQRGQANSMEHARTASIEAANVELERELADAKWALRNSVYFWNHELNDTAELSKALRYDAIRVRLGGT